MVISTTRWAKYLLSLALGVVVFFFVACNSTTTNNTHTGNGAETKEIITDNPIDTKCEETANSACKNSEEKSLRDVCVLAKSVAEKQNVRKKILLLLPRILLNRTYMVVLNEMQKILAPYS